MDANLEFPKSFYGYVSTDEKMELIKRCIKFSGTPMSLALDFHITLQDTYGPVIITRAEINDSLCYIYSFDHHNHPQPPIPVKMMEQLACISENEPRLFTRSHDPKTPYLYTAPRPDGAGDDIFAILASDGD